MAKRKAARNPFRGGRFHGKRLPPVAERLGGTLPLLVDPAAVPDEAQLTRDINGFLALRVKDRSKSAFEALEEAKRLVKVFHGVDFGTDPERWVEACRRCRVSVRTAENLLMLARLGVEFPAVFAMFARLGRTKLYHIARLPAETLEGMSPTQAVTLADGTRRTLRELSEKELLAWLRDVAPVAKRKRISGLRRLVVRCLAIASSGDRLDRMEPTEVKEIARKTQELFGLLSRAVRKPA
jgi:hypothetical protein